MDKITKGYPNWDIPLNNNIQEYNDTIGTEEMGTTATTVKGAIKELKKSIDTNKTDLSDKVQTNTADISILKTEDTEITTQLNDKVNKSDIVNDCNTDDANKIAGADQLKYLKDYIDNQMSGSIKKPYDHVEGTDGNTILTTGWHKCNTNINAPENGDYYILVINPYNTLIRQVWFGIWVNSSIFTRTCNVNNNWTWSSFKKLENE